MIRSLLLLCFLICTITVWGQKRKAPPSMKSKGTAQEKFLNKQFWLGFKAGVNLTEATPVARYSVMTPTNYDASKTDKSYRSFNKIGSHATLEVTFYYKGFSFSAQPTYRTSRFVYSNEYSWTNTETSNQRLDLKFDHEQQLDYADLPLLVKYEFTQNKLRPYVQIGAYYSILINATKSVTVSGTDNASGGTNTFRNEPTVVGAKDLFSNYWGLVGGVGLNYNLGNVRLVFDASYHKGMSNIANVNNRFSNDRLSGIGDAQDDLKLNNIVFSVGCLFPLRFLSNNFKSLD
jgi:outer membrane protein W